EHHARRRPSSREWTGCGLDGYGENMLEVRLLGLVMRHPHPAALARKVRDGSLFAALRQLQDRGLVTSRHGLYRLTRRARLALWMARGVAPRVARGQP